MSDDIQSNEEKSEKDLKGVDGKKPASMEGDVFIVRTYDEDFLYDLYCSSNGSISDMLKLIEHSPEVKKYEVPKKSALYNLAKNKNWSKRFSETKSAIKRNMEMEHAMTYSSIDQAAKYVMRAYLLKVMSIIKNKDFAKISHKDFKTLWEIQRVERGLVTNISANIQEPDFQQNLEKTIQDGGGEKFMKFLDTLSPEDQQKFLDVMGEDNPPNDDSNSQS